MTTEAQKQAETNYVKMFLNGNFEYTRLDTGAKPDFWVRRSSGADIGLEVIEYHPPAQGVQGRVRRAEVESRWWKGIWPILDRERRAMPSLESVHVHLGFTDRRLPRNSEHEALSRELVHAIEAAASQLTQPFSNSEVVFLPQDTIPQVGNAWGDDVLLAAEEWPLAARHMNSLRVSVWPGVPWPPWQCREVAGAWVGPEMEELCRDLEKKAAKARNYDLGGRPLWLLIVCDVFGDVQSHIFPRTDADVAELVTGLEETGFDFQGSPFSEVWLLSAFSGGRVRAYPRGTERKAGSMARLKAI
jgi:hypothetical protein